MACSLHRRPARVHWQLEQWMCQSTDFVARALFATADHGATHEVVDFLGTRFAVCIKKLKFAFSIKRARQTAFMTRL